MIAKCPQVKCMAVSSKKQEIIFGTHFVNYVFFVWWINYLHFRYISLEKFHKKSRQDNLLFIFHNFHNFHNLITVIKLQNFFDCDFASWSYAIIFNLFIAFKKSWDWRERRRIKQLLFVCWDFELLLNNSLKRKWHLWKEKKKTLRVLTVVEAGRETVFEPISPLVALHCNSKEIILWASAVVAVDEEVLLSSFDALIFNK